MQVDRKFIESEFDKFFEFDTEDKIVVLSVSCRLFAEHIAQCVVEQAIQGLEIVVTDQGLNVIRDGVLVAYDEHGVKSVSEYAAKKERERCAKLCRESDRYRGEYFARKIEGLDG